MIVVATTQAVFTSRLNRGIEEPSPGFRPSLHFGLSSWLGAGLQAITRAAATGLYVIHAGWMDRTGDVFHEEMISFKR